MTTNLDRQTFACSQPYITAMKTLGLVAMTALMFGSANAHAEGRHLAKTHHHLMSSHARLQERDAEMNRRDTAPTVTIPQFGYYGSSRTGRMDDSSAEGRTSGG